MASTQPISWSQMREYLSGVMLAIIYANFAAHFYQDYETTGRLSSLFYILFELIVVILSLVRRWPKSVSWKPGDWLYALAATALPLCFMPAPNQTDNVWMLLQLTGAFVSFAGIVSINRSFGIVPANRGIQTKGVFRFVRHPIYAGYCITDIAMVAQNWSYTNLCIAGAHYIIQGLRILREEQFLARDPDYAHYMTQVKWRLLPGVW